MSHRNARLSPYGRLLIVQRHQAGWKQAHIAAAMGISRHCVRKWIDRYADEGEPGLHDRSSRPHSMPTKTSSVVEEKVLAARREHRRGQDWIGPELGLAPRTVNRILRRHHVPRLAECDPITGTQIRASHATTIRYERDHPGDLGHMDVKKLGRIPDGGGWRAHGRSEEVRGRGNGYDYVHSLVDDHTRFAYSEVLDDEQAETCASFLRRAVAYFAEHGITRIEGLITDNALAYRRSSAMQKTCEDLGIRQKFIKPHCPWQNGKVERFNRTLQAEWAYRRAYTSNDDRRAALAPWLEYYNTARRHTALGGLPPISRMSPTC